MVPRDRVDFDPFRGKISPAQYRIVETGADPVRLLRPEQDQPAGIRSGLIVAPRNVVDHAMSSIAVMRVRCVVRSAVDRDRAEPGRDLSQGGGPSPAEIVELLPEWQRSETLEVVDDSRGERQSGRISLAPGIEQGKEGDLVAQGDELLGQLEGDGASEGMPAKAVRALGLNLGDLREEPGARSSIREG